MGVGIRVIVNRHLHLEFSRILIISGRRAEIVDRVPSAARLEILHLTKIKATVLIDIAERKFSRDIQAEIGTKRIRSGSTAIFLHSKQANLHAKS